MPSGEGDTRHLPNAVAGREPGVVVPCGRTGSDAKKQQGPATQFSVWGNEGSRHKPRCDSSPAPHNHTALLLSIDYFMKHRRGSAKPQPHLSPSAWQLTRVLFVVVAELQDKVAKLDQMLSNSAKVGAPSTTPQAPAALAEGNDCQI